MKMQTLIFNTFLPIRPVPASRPRVTHQGTYYPKNYSNFRKELGEILASLSHEFPQTEDIFHVDLEFICKRPQSPSHSYPRGDVDNFMKGPLDCITKAEMIWVDDTQVTSATVSKRYAINDEEPGIKVAIYKKEGDSNE